MLQLRRCNFLFLLTLIISPIVVRPQTTSAHLNLKAGLKHERYCKMEKNILELRLNFEVNLANNSDSDVSVYPHPHPLVVVSGSLNNLAHGIYELSLYPPDPGPDVSPADHANRQTSLTPTVLHRGDVFKSETADVVVPTVSGNERGKSPVLTPGIHYAQIVIEAQVQGTTSFVRTFSNPIRIRVQQPKVGKCQ